MRPKMLSSEVLDKIEWLKTELEVLTAKLNGFAIDRFDELESMAEKNSLKTRAEQIQSILRVVQTLRDVESEMGACELQFTNNDENVVARAKAFYNDFGDIKTGIESGINELLTASFPLSEGKLSHLDDK